MMVERLPRFGPLSIKWLPSFFLAFNHWRLYWTLENIIKRIKVIWYSFTHTNYIKSNQTTSTPDYIGSRLVTILATGRWTSSAVTASAPGRLTSISGDFTSSASERFDFHQRWLHFISIGAFAIHRRWLHKYQDAWLPSAVTPSGLRRLTSSTVIFAWLWSQILVHCVR